MITKIKKEEISPLSFYCVRGQNASLLASESMQNTTKKEAKREDREKELDIARVSGYIRFKVGVVEVLVENCISH